MQHLYNYLEVCFHSNMPTKNLTIESKHYEKSIFIFKINLGEL